MDRWEQLRQWMTLPQAQAWAEWVGGIGAVLAIALVGIGWRRERRAVRRAQAQRVRFSIADLNDRRAFEPGFGSYYGSGVVVTVRNGSDLSIYNCESIVVPKWRDRGQGRSGMEEINLIDYTDEEFIDEYEVPPNRVGRASFRGATSNGESDAIARFIDSGGKTWFARLHPQRLHWKLVSRLNWWWMYYRYNWEDRHNEYSKEDGAHLLAQLEDEDWNDPTATP